MAKATVSKQEQEKPRKLRGWWICCHWTNSGTVERHTVSVIVNVPLAYSSQVHRTQTAEWCLVGAGERTVGRENRVKCIKLQRVPGRENGGCA